MSGFADYATLVLCTFIVTRFILLVILCFRIPQIMTSPTKEVHQFYDFYRQDGPPFRFKHPKSLGDSSSRRDRDDSKMLAGEKQHRPTSTCYIYI